MTTIFETASRAEIELVTRDEQTPVPSARILVVDDEVAQMRALCDTLTDRGYTVTGYSDPVAAVAELARSPFDLVLTDMMMPGIGGIDVVRAAHDLDREIVGIIMTGQGSIATAVDAMKSGAFDYILKPFRVSALMPVLSRALAFRRMRLDNASLQTDLEARTRELERANRELKEAHVRELQSQKMASLGQLVAGIAHEINNPLAFVLSNLQTIRSNLEAVLDPLADTLDETAARRVQKIETRLADTDMGLARVRDLVLKLKTFSRIDAGRFGTYDMHESIDSVLLILNHRLRGRIEVRKSFAARRELACYGGELNQVFMNVIDNAIDAIAGSGVIAIRSFESGSEYCIGIRDNGAGMDAETLEHIFEPFFTRKPVGEGTGLGLSLSYGIVEAHRGAIDVQSTVGEGTEFIIRIPLDLDPADEP